MTDRISEKKCWNFCFHIAPSVPILPCPRRRSEERIFSTRPQQNVINTRPWMVQTLRIARYSEPGGTEAQRKLLSNSEAAAGSRASAVGFLQSPPLRACRGPTCLPGRSTVLPMGTVSFVRTATAGGVPRGTVTSRRVGRPAGEGSSESRRNRN